jgi:hypothetical protein
LQEGHQVLEKTTTLLSLIVTSINSRFDIVFSPVTRAVYC